MPVGLAAAEGKITVRPLGSARMGRKCRLAFFGANDKRIIAKMVVHESAEPLAEGTGDLEQYAERRIGVAVLYRGYEAGIDACVGCQLCARKVETFAVILDAVAEFL